MQVIWILIIIFGYKPTNVVTHYQNKASCEQAKAIVLDELESKQHLELITCVQGVK